MGIKLNFKMPVSHLKCDIYLFLCLQSTRLWQDEIDQEAQFDPSAQWGWPLSETFFREDFLAAKSLAINYIKDRN